MNDQPSDPSEVTNTGDAPYIQGSVNTGGGDFVGRDKVTIGAIVNNLFGSTPETVPLLRARKILLENVNKFWVEGVLKHSLYNEVLLTIGLEEKPSVVDNRPWDTVLQTPEQPDRPLSPGTKIIDVFDQHQQSLLILGMPGSGKTTILLELARDLIKRAQEDVTQAIPVVLNLSSWSVQRQPLADWIVAELNSKYYIAPKVAQAWVANDALLFLLDGLDEVNVTYRDKCVGAINTFRKTHVVALAVCSRIADYEALEQRLQLESAVFVRPLSQEQIDNYFVRLGAEYAMVQSTLRHDPVFLALVESPLMLSMMTLAYQGTTIETLETQGSTRTRRQHLFDTYIRRVFRHRSPTRNYSSTHTLHWLRWLAGNMVQRQQTIFLIERLQPDWLQGRTRLWLYRLVFGLALGLVFGLGGGLVFELGGGLAFGLDSGLGLGLGGGLIFGLVVGLIVGLGNIEPTERLVFSWRIDKDDLVIGLVVGLVIGMGIGLVFGLGIGLVFGLGVGLGGGLLDKADIVQHIRPNQGIRQSARNMWLGGLGGGLVFGLGGGLFFGLDVGLGVGLGVGLLRGMMTYGGNACIQHLAMRGLLTLYHQAPINYARFLDYCADRIFLRKVGGGYIFIHRLLMEHFAALTEEDIKRLAGSSDGR